MENACLTARCAISADSRCIFPLDGQRAEWIVAEMATKHSENECQASTGK
jgi:hypothetical protein